MLPPLFLGLQAPLLGLAATLAGLCLLPAALDPACAAGVSGDDAAAGSLTAAHDWRRLADFWALAAAVALHAAWLLGLLPALGADLPPKRQLMAAACAGPSAVALVQVLARGLHPGAPAGLGGAAPPCSWRGWVATGLIATAKAASYSVSCPAHGRSRVMRCPRPVGRAVLFFC